MNGNSVVKFNMSYSAANRLKAWKLSNAPSLARHRPEFVAQNMNNIIATHRRSLVDAGLLSSTTSQRLRLDPDQNSSWWAGYTSSALSNSSSSSVASGGQLTYTEWQGQMETFRRCLSHRDWDTSGYSNQVLLGLCLGNPEIPGFYEDVYVTGKGNCFYSALATAIRHSGDEQLIRRVNATFFPDRDPYSVGHGILENEEVAGSLFRQAIRNKLDPASNPTRWWKFYKTPAWLELQDAATASEVVPPHNPDGELSDVPASSLVSYVQWLGEMERFRRFLGTDRSWITAEFDSTVLVEVLSKMCPEMYIQIYDGNVNRQIGTFAQLGAWIGAAAEGLLKRAGRTTLRLHGTGSHFVPVCLRCEKMEVVDDVEVSLHLDREGPVPESPAKRTRTGSSSASQLRYRSQLRPLLDSGLINWRVRKGNPNRRKAQSKQLEPFQRWRTDNFRYVEKVCENRHPTLVKANRAYVYLDVGALQSQYFGPDTRFGERWQVVGYRQGDVTLPIRSTKELRQLLEQDSPDSCLRLVLRRQSDRVVQLCPDPESRKMRHKNGEIAAKRKRRRKKRLAADRQRLQSLKQRVQILSDGKSSSTCSSSSSSTSSSSSSSTSSSSSSSTSSSTSTSSFNQRLIHDYYRPAATRCSAKERAVLETFYAESNLSLPNQKPNPDAYQEITPLERASILRDWSTTYNNNLRISTCACCGGRDVDNRCIGDSHVPIDDLYDMFEVNREEAKRLDEEFGGLYHMVQRGNRFFRVVEDGTVWMTEAEREEHYGSSGDYQYYHSKTTIVRESLAEAVGNTSNNTGTPHQPERRHLYAMVCKICTSRIKHCRTLREDKNRKGSLPFPKRSVRYADWGRDPRMLGLPALSLLERAAISKYVVSYDVVTVVPGSDATKLRSHVICSPTDSVEKILELCATTLPRTDVSSHIQLVFVGTMSQKMSMMVNTRLRSQLSLDLRKIMLWLRLLVKVHPGYAEVQLPSTPEELDTAKRMLAKSRDDVICGIVCDGVVSRAMYKIIHSDATMDNGHQQQHGDFRHVVHLDDPAMRRDDLSDLHGLQTMAAAGGARGLSLGMASGEQRRNGRNVEKDEYEDQACSDNNDAPSCGESNSSGVTPERTRSVKVRMRGFGNEYEENHLIISGAFPTLFPLGLTAETFRTTGPPNRTVVKQLMSFYDGRFARCESLQFLFFSQTMRAKVNSSVNSHLNGNSSDIQELIDLLEKPGLTGDLATEIRNVGAGKDVSRQGKRMLKILKKCTKITGGKVAWSRAERKGTTAPIMALSQRFGIGSVFVTVSPPQFDSPLALRLSLGGTDGGLPLDVPLHSNGNADLPPSDWTFHFPSLSERVTQLANNPVSDAMVYRKIIDAFFTVLCRCRPVGQVNSTAHEVKHRQRGAFGTTRAFFGITESQRKGLLHMHVSDGTLS